LKGSSCGYRRCVAIILLGSLAALFHFCSTENVLAAAGTSANLPVQQNSLPQSAHENLMSIKGIGPVSASVLLSAIGNIRDSDPDKLAAYFGLVPRIQKSNETEHSGRITKQVNKLARTLWCSARSSPNATAHSCRTSITHPAPPRQRQGQHRTGAQIRGSHLSHPQKRLCVRGLPQLRPGLLKQA